LWGGRRAILVCHSPAYATEAQYLALCMRLGVADPACLARLRLIVPIVVRLGLTTARNSQILARLGLRERFKPWCDWGSVRRDGIARLRLTTYWA